MAPSSYEAVATREVVIPHSSMYAGVSGQASRSRRARAVSLLAACMAAAAMVALIGALSSKGAEDQPGELSIRGKLELIPDYMHRQHEHTTSDLAASAHTFMDTASGIMQDARTHALAGDLKMPTGIKLAAGREMELTMGATDGNTGAKTMGKILSTISGDQSTTRLAVEEPAVNATEVGGAQAGPPKVLGATGQAVFGGSNSSVVGFLGFSKKEPTFFGVPFPIVMFGLVIFLCCSCITVGCIIARKTDILKVNVEPAGANAQPVDDLEDTKGYYWRQNDKK